MIEVDLVGADRLANWLRFKTNRWLGGQGRLQYDSHQPANPKRTRLSKVVEHHQCSFSLFIKIFIHIFNYHQNHFLLFSFNIDFISFF